MIKTLEAWCLAKKYQGGHIFMMLEDLSLNKNTIDRKCDAYKFGCRDARLFNYGNNIASYPVPVNSFDSDPELILSFILGLHETLDLMWEKTAPYLNSDYL